MNWQNSVTRASCKDEVGGPNITIPSKTVKVTYFLALIVISCSDNRVSKKRVTKLERMR